MSQLVQESIPPSLFLLFLETYFNCRKLCIYNLQVRNHTVQVVRCKARKQKDRQGLARPWHIWLHWYFDLFQNTLHPGLAIILLLVKCCVNVEFMKCCILLTTTAYIQTEKKNVREQSSCCTGSASYPTAIWQ